MRCAKIRLFLQYFGSIQYFLRCLRQLHLIRPFGTPSPQGEGFGAVHYRKVYLFTGGFNMKDLTFRLVRREHHKEETASLENYTQKKAESTPPPLWPG